MDGAGHMANGFCLMGQEITKAEDLEGYGPAMSACTPLQRRFVELFHDHPTWNAVQLAEAAGSKATTRESMRVTGQRLMHDDKVLAAMNEEACKRIKTGGMIGVAAVVKIALNESHKDHLKAALALMDRTGFHALSEHKVTVDDKRPQSKRELIEATKNVLSELGMSPADASKFLSAATNEDIVEAEFTVVSESTVTLSENEEPQTETAEDW
jgi:hypothetical protein